MFTENPGALLFAFACLIACLLAILHQNWLHFHERRRMDEFLRRAMAEKIPSLQEVTPVYQESCEDDEEEFAQALA